MDEFIDDDYIDTDKMSVSQKELEHAALLISQTYSLEYEDVLKQLDEAREKYGF